MNHADFIEAYRLIRQITGQPNKDSKNDDILHHVASELNQKKVLGVQQKEYLKRYKKIFSNNAMPFNDFENLNDLLFKNNNQRNTAKEVIMEPSGACFPIWGDYYSY